MASANREGRSPRACVRPASWSCSRPPGSGRSRGIAALRRSTGQISAQRLAAQRGRRQPVDVGATGSRPAGACPTAHRRRRAGCPAQPPQITAGQRELEVHLAQPVWQPISRRVKPVGQRSQRGVVHRHQGGGQLGDGTSTGHHTEWRRSEPAARRPSPRAAGPRSPGPRAPACRTCSRTAGRPSATECPAPTGARSR